MREYFANVDSNLSKSNKSDISLLKIFSKSIMQSFMLLEITVGLLNAKFQVRQCLEHQPSFNNENADALVVSFCT